MCGPIAVALPPVGQSKWQLLFGRIVYNAGRILTYTLLGVVFGFIGKTIMLAGYQQAVSIGLGVLILVGLFLPTKWMAKLTGAGWHARMMGKMKHVWAKLFDGKSISGLGLIGLLNGFLPCGLVYVALAGSLSTGSPVGGAAYMALFGIGTFPVMLAVAMFSPMMGHKVRNSLRRLVPVAGVILAVLFILRGMALGIPYVSPKLSGSGQMGDTMSQPECCH
jgi:sulfite exporter TauE/SafE